MAEGFMDRLAERMSRFSNSKTVFGDPIERDGVTVIPVSKLLVKFKAFRKHGENEETAGGAGAAKVCHKPVGFVEIKGGKPRFRPVQDPDHVALAILGSGLLLFLTIRTVLKRGAETNLSLMDAMKRVTQLPLPGTTKPQA